MRVPGFYLFCDGGFFPFRATVEIQGDIYRAPVMGQCPGARIKDAPETNLKNICSQRNLGWQEKVEMRGQFRL